MASTSSHLHNLPRSASSESLLRADDAYLSSSSSSNAASLRYFDVASTRRSALQTSLRNLWRRPVVLLLALLVLLGMLVTLSSPDSLATLNVTIDQHRKNLFGSARGRLSYRAQLEQHYGGHNFSIVNSETLGFDNIYVVSVPSAVERREQMSKIARAHGLTVEIFDAIAKNLPVIDWIADRVSEVREVRRPVLAKALNSKPSDVGGGSVDTIWLQDEAAADGFDFPDYSKPEWKVAGKPVSWVEYLASLDTSKLQSNLSEAQVREKLSDHVEKASFYQLSSGVVACFYSHVLMWQNMVSRGFKTALFLEDDIDLEWDMDRLLPNVLRFLPEDWDIVYLGHCWSSAHSKPQYLSPILRTAARPMCTHAYALSDRGVRRMLEVVGSPWTVYNTAVDIAMARAIKDQKLKAFVVEPPLVIQSKSSPSSVQTGPTVSWRGLLMDSTLDRIWRGEGMQVPLPTWDEIKGDPSIWA